MIFVLGHAFSGSTLFSLALGADKRFLNLGEVSSLEHDYNDSTKCTCGKPLIRCPFYEKLKSGLAFWQASIPETIKWHLEGHAGSAMIDRRHRHNTVAQNLKLVAGAPVHRIFPESEIQRYLKKNELFFTAVKQIFSEYDFIVDCSKSPKRLEIFLNSQEMDLRVIYLQRPNETCFASRMKRVKKRISASHRNFLNRFFFTSAFAIWQQSEMAR